MKVCIISFSGNTGKTTLRKHLFGPLLKAKQIQIEDVNTGDGEPDLELAAGKFRDLAAVLNVAEASENFVIDTGASNAHPMMVHFSQLKRTRSAIDFWLIPVVPAKKQILDGLNTIQALLDIGVEPSKIVVIINNVQDTFSVHHDFAAVFAAKSLGIVVADQAVLASQVYEMMKGGNESVFDLANNPPDFSALRIEARKSGAEALAKLGEQMVTQDMAEDAAVNLKAVFDSTPPPVPI